MYDLIVVGGGPAGYTAAERAGRAGLKALLFEGRALGGVCLNEGCIPSKTLLNSAKMLDHAREGAAYGVSVQGASLDHAAVVARKDKVVQTLVHGVAVQMKLSGVDVVYERAEIIDRNSVKAGDKVFEAKNLLIATGSAPIMPPIPGLGEGLKSGFVLTNRELLDLTEVPEKLVIIGGGVVGLEMASYFNSAGSKVTVVEMLPKIAGQTDPDISKALMEAYTGKGVEFLCNARVTEIAQGKAVCDCGEIAADKVLASIGRRPATEGFGLEKAGVALNKGAIATDAHMLTSVPNIYAAGDVTGKYMLAHAAYREAEVAVNHILGVRDAMRYDAVPSVIYTSPEVACVGETEESAAAKGLEYIAVTAPMKYNGRFVAENINHDGICKMLVEKRNRRIIGFHMIGSYASEIIASACIMIEMQMTAGDAREVVFPHPCVCEIIKEAATRAT